MHAAQHKSSIRMTIFARLHTHGSKYMGYTNRHAVGNVVLGLVLVFVLAKYRLWHQPVAVRHKFDEARTLLVLYGQPRGGEYAWKSIHKHVLAPLNAHLATFFTTDCPHTILSDMAKYHWTTHAHQDWGVVLDEVATQCSSNTQWRKLCALSKEALGGITECNHVGSGGIMLAFRWLVQQKILELGLDQKYDYMILSRTDQLHLCDHKPMSTLRNGSVVVPYGEEYSGWPDRHIFADTPSFIRSINITNDLVCNADAWSVALSNHSVVNPEIIQRVVWDKYNLDVVQTERTMLTVKTLDDTTRWSDGEENVLTQFVDLKVKYPGELQLVLSQCSDQLSFVKELQHIRDYKVIT